MYDGLGVAADARAEIVRLSDLALQAVAGMPSALPVLQSFAEKLIGRAK